MEWLTNAGVLVSKPLFESPDYDLIAEFDGHLVRVQVKTSTFWRNDRFELALATRGGNQSWNGLVKIIDASRCDFVFAHVGDGRRWYIPVQAVEGRLGILLGGPKYSEYEVTPAAPLRGPRSPTATTEDLALD